jgi:hypothetical protein
MNERKVIFACLTVIVILGVILGGFAYAYINKVNKFNQTKSYIESLGFNISNNVLGMDISTYIKGWNLGSAVPVADVASFVSEASDIQNFGVPTIYTEGFSFYMFLPVVVYEYTPNSSIWWIWG